MMASQNEQTDAHLSEGIAALRDLTRLCLDDSTMAETMKTKLLERLLALCVAQRGGIFLVLSPVSRPGLQVPFTFSNGRGWYPYVLHNMHEQEADDLITSFLRENIQFTLSSYEPSWMLWRPQIEISLPQKQGDERDDTQHSFQLLFICGWEGKDLRSQKSCALLPLLAETVGMLITNALLMERVKELEIISDCKALQEMELLTAELLASVSHELRSPLASIKGYAATLLRHEHRISREERHEFLVAINQGSDRLAHVINSLLEISELETGSVVIYHSAVNICSLVREAITSAQQRFGKSEGVGQEQSMAMPPPIPQRWTFTLHLEHNQTHLTDELCIIQADYSRLREVLDQLLENAILHSQQGGAIDIVIRPGITQETMHHLRIPSKAIAMSLSEAVLKHQQMVEISVSDHGKGIPAHHLERIFDRFYQVDTQLTRAVNGLGLGLTMCKRIIELHNGIIWAESTVGKGSTFYIYLPMENAKNNTIPLINIRAE